MLFLTRLFGFIACFILCFKGHAQNNMSVPIKKIVMITQIVEHPALTAVRKGVIESLKHNGYDPATVLELYYQNAQGNSSTASQIAQNFAGKDPSVVVAISTPSAQTMVSAARGKFPVVFAAVTDPVAAKLVKSLQNPGLPVTGVIDLPPFDQQLQLMKQILGSKNRLGVLYNPGEINSMAALDIIKPTAIALGFQVVESIATKSSEVGGAVQAIMDKVDAIYLPNDNIMASSLESILKLCEEKKVPVFAADLMLVERGVIATIGYDYEQMGEVAGMMVVDILNGKDANQMPVQSVKQNVLYINQTAASKWGLVLPEGIIKQAIKIF